jgi:rare lipoprotein A
MSIMRPMNRKQQTSGLRNCRAATYSRHEDQNRPIITISIGALDCGLPRDPGLDRGDIVAKGRPPSGETLRYSRLLERRSTRRVSAMLAGLIACATASPAGANGTGTNGTEVAPTEQTPMGQAGDANRIWISETGTASWYGQRHHGRRTSSGSRFDQHAMTAAHPWLPLGAKVKVTRRDTGQSIVVTITDRLPTKKHIIDLSYGAAQRLGVVRSGIAEVDLEPV